jgi:uncharacterized protein (TIGR02271 family)
MALHKIKDFAPDYRSHFDDQDIIGYDLYAGPEKVGSVDDVLVDDTGKIRYLVINTGFWILGKQVLLPIGRAQIENQSKRITVEGFTRTQVEALPKYDGNMPIDNEYEEQVRGVYRPNRPMDMAASPLDTAAPVETAALDDAIPAAPIEHDRENYTYDRDPALYNLNDQAHQNLRLYEERLIAGKTRAKTGEVTVGKHVETETTKVSVPLEKERVVIERTSPTGEGTAVTPGDTAFQEGEIARMEVYEETPDIHKEAFVREEVSVRKQVDQQTINAEEALRREELDIKTEGTPVVDKGSDTRRPENRP